MQRYPCILVRVWDAGTDLGLVWFSAGLFCYGLTPLFASLSHPEHLSSSYLVLPPRQRFVTFCWQLLLGGSLISSDQNLPQWDPGQSLCSCLFLEDFCYYKLSRVRGKLLLT